MLNYQGQQIDQLAIWFVDGLAIAASPDPDELVIKKAEQPVNYDWFDIFVLVPNNEAARLWKADIIAPSFKDEYLTRMVADFWMHQTSNDAYWKSWWIETTTGDRYHHEFTCRHQADVAKHFNLNHPEEKISSIVGKERVYLVSSVRPYVDSDPFRANQPISTLLQFDSVS